jgi:mannose-6-phosphate isomerase-like protein (cupin superfamily)
LTCGPELAPWCVKYIFTQTPHSQDELYIVLAGSGTFFKNGETRPFRAGDVIFVEAGAEHRFQNFSEDFETWVVFWGPEGGE